MLTPSLMTSEPPYLPTRSQLIQEEQQGGWWDGEGNRQLLGSSGAGGVRLAIPLHFALAVQSAGTFTDSLVWTRKSQLLTFLLSAINSKVHDCCLTYLQLFLTDSESGTSQ